LVTRVSRSGDGAQSDGENEKNSRWHLAQLFSQAAGQHLLLILGHGESAGDDSRDLASFRLLDLLLFQQVHAASLDPAEEHVNQTTLPLLVQGFG
jgi:hypothetical protein